MNLVSNSQILSSSYAAYDGFLQDNDVLSDMHPYSKMVHKTGNKLAKACQKFLNEHSDSNLINGFDWEFNVVEGNALNAFCMPGGKVVVYTGLVESFPNEDHLAVVLSHEIAHAVARHSNERISQQMLAQMGGSIVRSIVESSNQTGVELDEVIGFVYDLGANMGLLAFSRNHESEADKMGLVFMEYAGYDGEMAISFWEKMNELSKTENQPPVFMSTHPSGTSRINEIKAYIPVAKSYVNKWD